MPIIENQRGKDMEFRYEHKGVGYIELLRRFHEFLRPQSYFEIGTLTGSTLGLAGCPTIAVDPCFQLNVSATDNRSVSMFFQTTSDRFFERFSPKELLGRPIDLAFLDGLHEAETLLRDFANTEKHCNANSIIALHDCVPADFSMITRAQHDGAWTGDVWKVIPILKEFRPEIHVHIYDAGPTGLVCCTNLNPASTTLKDAAGEIWKKWSKIDLESYGFDKLIQECDIESTEIVNTPQEMRRFFWL